MERPLPRYDATRRRDFLKRAAALGAAALVPGVLDACSAKSDQDVFADGSTTTAADSTASTTTPTTTADTPTTSGSATGGEALPASAQLEVAFTYTASGSERGPARNPFIAVWVESADGDLVATVSLWYNPPKGDRWLNELANWYAAESAVFDTNDGSDLDAVTGASRPAGTFTVAWDGTGIDGDRVPAGDYTVFVESAREHGPHSLTSASITLGSSAADVSMPDDSELSAASARFTA